MPKSGIQMFIKKIILAASLLSIGCVLEPMDPGEEAAYVSGFCLSRANQLPSPHEIVTSDSTIITYSQCMVDQGYLDNLGID